MQQSVFILLCLQLCVIHVAENGRIIPVVEKKAMEKSDILMAHEIIRRAANNDNGSGNTTTASTRTITSQNSVLEYVTSQQTDHNSSVNVHQLDNSNSDTTTTTTPYPNTTHTTQIIHGENQTAHHSSNSTPTTLAQTSLTSSTKEKVLSTSNVPSSKTETSTVKNNGSLTAFINATVSVESSSSSNDAANSSNSTFTQITPSLRNESSHKVTKSTKFPTTLTLTKKRRQSTTSLSVIENLFRTSGSSSAVTTSTLQQPFPLASSTLSTLLTSSDTQNSSTGVAEPSTEGLIKSEAVVPSSSLLTRSTLPTTTTVQITKNTTASSVSATVPKSESEPIGNHPDLHTVLTSTTVNPAPDINSTDYDSDIPISEPEPDPTTADILYENITTVGDADNSTIEEPHAARNNTLSEPDTPVTETEPNTETPVAPHRYSTTQSNIRKSTQISKSITHSTTPSGKTSASSNTEHNTIQPEPEDYITQITQGTSVPSAGSETSIQTSNPENSYPTSEPENNNPTSEPENSYPTSEPEKTTPTDDPVGAEAEFNFDVFAEPGPDWPVAKIAWKEAWEFHIYFFGVAFVLLGLYCLFCIIQLWKMDHLLSRHYFMTLHVLVMLICLFRSSYLLIDAYNSLGTFPIVLDYFLYSTVFPCLTAVFSILFYALLLAVRVRVISEKVQKLWVLLLITGLHFALSFATDIVVGLFSTAGVMLLICQSFFILWGLIIFIGYLVIFRRVYKSAVNRQEALRRNSTYERKNNITQGFQEKPPKQNYRLGLAVKVTLVSSFFGLACVCFELYGLFGVYGVMRTDKPKPWPWWVYHSIVRCLEIAMCSSIAYVASQPLKYTYKKKYKDHVCMKALPCRYLCCADIISHRDETDMSLDQYAVSETDHLGWLKKLKLKKFSVPDTNTPYPPHAAEKYSDPDATLLVRKINKPKPSMLVVEDGFVRIRRDDEIAPANQCELDSNSRSSMSSGMNNVSVLPDTSYTINETQRHDANQPTSPRGVANAGFAQEDVRVSFRGDDRNSFHGDNRVSFQGDVEHETDIADETDIDIAVTDCENSDGYDTPVPVSDENSGGSGDIFRPLSDIDLAASMESELERAFHTSHHEDTKNKQQNKISKTYKKSYSESGYTRDNQTDDDWSDSSDGTGRTPDMGLLRKPIRRCKSAETKEQQQRSKLFDKNRYFSLSSIDSIGKQDVQNTDLGNKFETC